MQNAPACTFVVSYQILMIAFEPVHCAGLLDESIAIHYFITHTGTQHSLTDNNYVFHFITIFSETTHIYNLKKQHLHNNSMKPEIEGNNTAIFVQAHPRLSHSLSSSDAEKPGQFFELLLCPRPSDENPQVYVFCTFTQITMKH